MSFTIQNALIPVDSGYETVDVQVVDNCISAIAPNLELAGTVINGKNKLLLPGFVNLQKIGFLSPRISLAHCVWLDDSDIVMKLPGYS